MLRLAPRLLVVLALVVAAAFATTASAAEFVVDSTADTEDAVPGDGRCSVNSGACADIAPGNGVCATTGGACTLRAAVEETDALAGRDSIVLPPGTYPLAARITVSSLVWITGPAGARATTIQGAANTPALELTGSGIELRGVTVTGGSPGLVVGGDSVTVDQVAVKGNRNIVFASAFGGGIRVTSGAGLTLTRSAVTGNTTRSASALALGGGIYVGGGATLNAIATTIAGNTVSAPANTALGGGIYVEQGFSPLADVTLRHVTLAGNVATAPLALGGNLSAGGATRIQDTIIAGGQAGSGTGNCNNGVNAFLGGNIDSEVGCFGGGAGNLIQTDPQLLPLGDYGGPTDTMPIAQGSPARDAALACPTGGLDQRGAPAPAGSGCDVGAAELSSDLGVSVQASRTDVPAGGDVTYVARVVNAGPDPAPAAALDIAASGGAVSLATASSGTCGSVARCELGTLARGQEVTATLRVRAEAGPVVLSLRTSSSVPDAVNINDAATVTTPVRVAEVASVTTQVSAPAPADATAPRLSGLRVVGTARRGRTVRVRTTLSEAATITLRVERLLAGRRVGRACRVSVRAGARCTVGRTVGTVRTRASAGGVRLVIPARLAGKVLAPGAYRVSITAVDAAGNRSTTQQLKLAFAR